MKWCFLFQNDPKNVDPSYKTDLDFWDCFGKENKKYPMKYDKLPKKYEKLSQVKDDIDS